MSNKINYIIPIEYLVMLLVMLIGAFIALRGNFAQKLWFSKKATNDKKIFLWLEPFRNSLVNIESGEHNHIFIMNTFFQFQKNSIIRIRTEIKSSKFRKTKTAWNKYEKYYENNAKDQVHGLFGIPEKEKLNELKKHMTNIMKEIKKLKA